MLAALTIRITGLNWRVLRLKTFFLVVFALVLPVAKSATVAKVELLRTPEGGIQPQAMVDAKGLLHLVYYKGDAKAGDIFYVRRDPGAATFSQPMRVNANPGAAIAIGTIRGAQMALGKNHRVHVVWNGNSEARGHHGAPLWYTRLNDAGTAFEPERDLITYAAGLDGGSSVAADPFGNVSVVWHAHEPGAPEGEANRAVFVARSIDEGKTFAREERATRKQTGACGCCGLKAFADSKGAVYILYRGAMEKVNRDEILLLSPKPGAPFEVANTHPWLIASCPMSSASFYEAKGATLAAWETASQVYFTRISAGSVVAPMAPPGQAKRKHPVAVANHRGETLVAWTEGTGWQKGGAVAWQLFDSNDKPTAEQGKQEGVPVWSLITSFAQPDGRFVVVY
jgi:hypothetical protein